MGEELAAARERIRLTGQPHSYLFEQLQETKAAKKQLEAQLETLKAVLQVRVLFILCYVEIGATQRDDLEA